MQLRMTLNSRSSWLHLPSTAKITTGVYHHAGFLFGDGGGTQVLSMLGKHHQLSYIPAPLSDGKTEVFFFFLNEGTERSRFSGSKEQLSSSGAM